ALVGAFDWSKRQLNARETITLDVAPGHPTIELDTRVVIDAIKTASGASLAFQHDTASALLKVELGGLVTTGGRIALVVDYHVGASGALIASDGRDDDPVTSRMVFTDSEPDRAREWMVANDHPSDRAIWTVEITVPAGEDVVANGVRMSDKTVDGARVVRYRLEQRIPTYMMAFAAGELVHTDRTTGRVPLSIWHRRGLLVNEEAHLDILADLMPRFEALLGPYPWPSYGVLLVPFPFAAGGMENASITFNVETTGQANIGRQTNAHELGHQWFGDWVTMADYEHVWFKEGMATVLQSEGDRRIRDSGAVPRLFGLDYAFSTNQAIVDHQLYGLARYTSGPYQRAAWLITQIRARIGETAFWAALRKMLDANALGTLTGPRFLEGFAPALSAAEIAQLVATLELKTTPTIGLAFTSTGDHRDVTVTLSDPDHQLIVPLELTVVDGAGAASVHEVHAGEPAVVSVPVDGYIAPDENELSASWNSTYNVSSDVFFGQFTSLFAPFAPEALTAFESRSTAHQELTLANFGLSVDPAGFAAFYAGLDSTLARRNAETAVCRNSRDPTTGDAWRALIPLFLANPGIESFSTAFSGCIAPQAAIDELAQIAAAPTPANARRLSYLLSFDYGDASIDQIGSVAVTAPSLQLREQALTRLAVQLNGTARYSPVGNPAPWHALFRDQLAHAETAIRFNIAWNASRLAPTDLDALPIVAGRLHIYALTDDARRRVVCQASDAAIGADAAWQSFRAALHRDALPASVLEVADNPLACAPGVRALSQQPERVLSKPL
ncbi:MAG TPA: M1 family aminopeptidase, partial [Kofleriaceae bacterium]|nr:M1 family aminopeptidase [Kofleriaceae bacterium]